MTDHRANPQDGIAIALTALTEFDRYADDGGPVDRNVGRVYGLLRNALADWKLRELHHFETEQENARLQARIQAVRSLIAREGGTNVNILNRILDEL